MCSSYNSFPPGSTVWGGSGGWDIKLSALSSLLVIAIRSCYLKSVGLPSGAWVTGSLQGRVGHGHTHQEAGLSCGRPSAVEPALSVPAWTLCFRLQSQALSVQRRTAPPTAASLLCCTLCNEQPFPLALLLFGMLSR